MRLAEPGKHLEAITSRRLLLSAIAERTRHARQTTLRVASSHAKAGCVARREGLRKLDRVESRERQARVTDRNERAWMTRRLSDEPATPDLNSLCTHATSNAGTLSLKLVPMEPTFLSSGTGRVSCTSPHQEKKVAMRMTNPFTPKLFPRHDGRSFRKGCAEVGSPYIPPRRRHITWPGWPP